jgi:hypothetical protein
MAKSYALSFQRQTTIRDRSFRYNVDLAGDHMRSLDFNAKYLIRQNIRNSKKNRYLPIGFDKLSSENKGLHDIISARDD